MWCPDQLKVYVSFKTPSKINLRLPMGYRFVLSFIKSMRLLALYYNRSRNKQNQKNNCVQTTTIKTKVIFEK